MHLFLLLVLAVGRRIDICVTIQADAYVRCASLWLMSSETGTQVSHSEKTRNERRDIGFLSAPLLKSQRTHEKGESLSRETLEREESRVERREGKKKKKNLLKWRCPQASLVFPFFLAFSREEKYTSEKLFLPFGEVI